MPRASTSSTSMGTSDNDSDSESGSDRFAEGEMKGGTFGDQFLALMERLFRQINRKKVGFFLELFIPLLFVVITLIMWLLWPPILGETRNYTWYGPADWIPSFRDDSQSLLACYNGTEIPSLQPCSVLALNPDAYINCSAGTSKIPVDGLCSNGATQDFSNETVNGFSIGVISGPMVPVQGWLATFNASSFITPGMDQLIIFQWLARMQPGSSITSQIVGAGFMSNSKQNAILASGNLYFVGSDLDGLLDYFRSESLLFDYVYGGTYASMADANTQVRNNTYNWAVVEVRSMTRDLFDVQIHMNSTALPSFDQVSDLYYGGGYAAERADVYAVSGFLTLQKIISEYYIAYKVKGDGDMEDVKFRHFFGTLGFQDFVVQPLLVNAGLILPFIFVLSFLYPVTQLTKQIVLEKELRIREATQIMGMRTTPLYLSWYVRFMLPNFIVVIITTIIVKITYMTISDSLLFFFIYFLYALTCVPMSGFFSAFFSKARLASLLTPLIYFIFATPIFAITSANTTVITIFCIFPPTAFAVCLMNFIQHEQSGGFGSSSWKDPRDSPQMYLIMIMMAVDFVFFNLLMLYLDAVMPKQWGSPKSPLFCIIDPIRACCGGSNKNLEGGPDGRASDGVFEPEENVDDHAVDMCGLRKEYSRNGKKFLAVNNLYWGMREGEISVLLGHNGAGKTTVLNMMTGMTEPDQGDCYVYDLSVRTELSRVRQQIGYCPQHNILWPELSCREHLEFYGKIKGLKGWELEDAVCRMLSQTDLMEKIDDPSKSLSGGQKRKLSVAIAFVATSRLAFLDEPTAGMDVGARRYTWELLRRMAVSHTILLTTHYMDEADLLGHRIGIMSQGHLKCSGSGMFLKSRLGVGYSITLSLSPDADTDQIGELVFDSVDGSTEMGINGCEAMYRMPNASVEQFPLLLDHLDANLNELGVRGYSLSATTLEEIFLGVSEADFALLQSNDPLMQMTDDVIARQEDRIWNCGIIDSDWGQWRSQFDAMMVKRFWNGIRDRRMQCFQIVTPVVCILIAMLLSLISFASPRELEIRGDMYKVGAMMEISQCDQYFGNYGSALDDLPVRRLNVVNNQNLSYYTIDTFYRSPLGAERVGTLTCYDPNFDDLFMILNNVQHLTNSSTYHQAPLSFNLFFGALQRRFGSAAAKMRLTAGTLEKTKYEKGAEDTIKTILMGAIIMIPFTFLPSNPVAWVVKERECKARHLQDVSGLRFFVYWMTNFFFDIAAYILTMLLVIIIFACFSRSEYIAPGVVGGTFTLFIVYGLTSTVTGYLCSFAFNEHSTAQTITMAVSFVTGFLLVMIVYVFGLLENTQNIANTIRWVARIIPSFCIGEGIINLAMLDQTKIAHPDVTVWSMQTIGWPCVYMAAEFPIFAILTLVIDHPVRRLKGQMRKYDRNAPPRVPSDEDSDVEEERFVVYDEEERGINHDMVRVIDLRKVYSNGKEAVQNVTFRVIPGEVFGFLGTNGAGKTTTIAMLCQEFIPTSGTAYICGYDVAEDSVAALQCIGYCPQFDATLDLLSVQEHLYLYAGIRSIEKDQRDDVVDALLRMCELSEYRHTLSHELSGGNRRKLSFAMSLVGGPRVVFLDEPSAGMDPVARRGLWNAIEKVAGNSSVVLTTHHLEEVEALAHRVAIMVDGTVRCIGDKTHLKTKYGSGFQLNIRVESAKYTKRVERWVESNFPKSHLNEFKSNRFVYELPGDVPLSTVFRMLQGSQSELHVIDYSVSQTSIEQVFLRISGELEEAEQYVTRFAKH